MGTAWGDEFTEPVRLKDMRRLIVSNIVSLDGFYEGPGSNVLALPMDRAFDAYNLERLRDADTLLLGHTTYEGFKAFWPGVADDPKAAAQRLGIPTEVLDNATHREISERQNAVTKVVVSDRLTPEETDPWSDTTHIVRRADAHDAIADLKRAPGRDILVFGSRILWNDLLAAHLIDELHLIIGAAILGGGTRAFGDAPTTPLRLLGARSFDGSHNVLVRYAFDRRS